MSENNTRQGGISFCGVLTIVFVVLKALNLIDWSWWWVFSPVWIPISIAMVVLAVMLLVSAIIEYRSKK